MAMVHAHEWGACSACVNHKRSSNSRMPVDAQLLPHYKLNKIIGTGAYGSVYQAVDSRDGKLVAVKHVKKLFNDLTDCKRILREVSIMSRLRHGHIVHLLDVYSFGGADTFDELFIAMELCDSDLRRLIKQDVFLGPAHVNMLAYNFFVGLQYLHSAGVIHRDLKPANCLVNKDCSIKICDFGLARALEEDFSELSSSDLDRESDSDAVPDPPAELRRSLTEHVVTRWYRAPELILLQPNYSQAIDVWSAGCIFAELLMMLEGTDYSERRPLFPGKSCFPLSPAKKNDKTHHRNRVLDDQLTQIFDLLGTPTPDDLGWLECSKARRYVEKFEQRPGGSLQGRLPGADALSLSLLASLLRFNPQERITTPSCLSHELFSEMRYQPCETLSPTRVVLGFDTGGGDLDEASMRRLFAETCEMYQV